MCSELEMRSACFEIDQTHNTNTGRWHLHQEAEAVSTEVAVPPEVAAHAAAVEAAHEVGSLGRKSAVVM